MTAQTIYDDAEQTQRTNQIAFLLLSVSQMAAVKLLDPNVDVAGMVSELLATATPAGRMVFTVWGAVAEPERSLIAERVRAAIRNARAKGVRLGRRARTDVNPQRVAKLRASGLSWTKVAAKLDCGVGTAVRAA